MNTELVDEVGMAEDFTDIDYLRFNLSFCNIRDFCGDACVYFCFIKRARTIRYGIPCFFVVRFPFYCAFWTVMFVY